MIVVKIIGGLGNQMFQYAYAKSLVEKGHKVKIDISAFRKYKLHKYDLNQFNIDINIASSFSNLLSKIRILKPVKEKSLLFDEKMLSLKENSYAKGYFQTEKYFKHIRDILLKEFSIKKEISASTKGIAENILNQKESCSLHIRRGNYISDKKANSIHGTCNLKYYEDAVKLISKKNKNIHFFVFSDDILWVKENLKIKSATYIDHKVIPNEDIHLMSLCTHNITANSSFSWWGAWLNKNENKTVIAPKQWFVSKENEIACSSWIKL